LDYETRNVITQEIECLHKKLRVLTQKH